jgi:putative transposase
MDTRKVATEYRLTQWSQAIREKVSKGESIQEFCESRGISKNTYFYWQRKLRESVCQGLMPPTNDTAIVPSGWAVCEPAKPPGGESMVQIEIGKYRVNVSAGVSSGELEKVCRVLMSLC